MSKAIAYGRLSHRRSLEHVNHETGDVEGLSMQEEHARRYWQCYLEKDGVIWGGFVPDKAISARSRPFDQRPGGKVVLDLLEPGDHLIFDKIDRMWRSIEDFVFLCKILENRQINWHICNLMGVSVRRGTPMGDFLINIMVSIAQLSSDETSDRIIASRAFLRSQGRYAGTVPGIGMKPVRRMVKLPDGRQVRKIVDLVWDPEMRAAMALIVRMRDVEGLGYRRIASLLNERLVTDLGFPPHSRDRLRMCSVSAVETVYIRERQYMALGNPSDPKLVNIPAQFVHPKSWQLKEKIA